MVWNKRNSQRRHRGHSNDVFSDQCRGAVSTRACKPSSRSDRRQPGHRNHPTGLYYYFLVGLLSVSPAFANEDPKVQNTSNPVAAATGNVTNQAVQFQNNGAPSRQYFAANNSCNGTTMQFSPFYMGNDTVPYESTGYVRSNNFGVQLNFSVPLDGGMIETCKAIARKHEQKMRLDYELVRALKCTEIMKAGFTFRPGSRVEVLCHDIVPIVSLTND
jgi:hypothetical protein